MTSENTQSKTHLRLWLRLLKTQRHIENSLRDHLRADFDSTLPRFDVLAALDRAENGLRMSELSAILKVSNGNVTGIIERLVCEQQVERIPVQGDRRAMVVRLTKSGKARFSEMAKTHEGWVSDMLSTVSIDEAEALCATFDTLNNTLDKKAKS